MEFIERNIELFYQIIYSLLTIAGGYIVIKLLNSTVFKQMRDYRKFDEGTANFVYRIVKILEWLIVIIIVLSIFNLNLGPILASLGIAGFIVGFALKEVLSNFASGVMIMVYKPFLVGDYIEVGKDIKGTVKDIGISALQIKTFTNEKITVPNSAVWGNPITNFSAYPTRRIKLEVGISYNADIGQAMKIIMGILKKDKRILDEPKYKVVVSKMADSAMILSVRGFTKRADFWATKFDLNKEIKEKLEEGGINIPFPQMDVHVKK